MAVKNSTSATVRRLYSRVPLSQVVPSTEFVPKPDLTGNFPRVVFGILIDQLDPEIPVYTYFSQTAITSDSGSPATGITGGTFTISFDGDTTGALAWNAAAGTVESALNGLSSVIAYGAVVVTGDHLVGYTITWVPYAASSIDTSSLTATDAFITTALPFTAGMTQQVQIQSNWNAGNWSVTSSVTPADANPLVFTDQRTGILVRGYSAGLVFAAGGDYTITAFGQTTAAINWSADLPTISAAINALSEITDRGGSTISGSPLNTGVPPSTGSYIAGLQNLSEIDGGTFTLTVLGQTTGAIAYNASLGTISTAINALSNVIARGGVTVGGVGFSGDYNRFSITFANIPGMTGSAASLTPSGSSLSMTTATSQGLVNTLSFGFSPDSIRILIAPGHGVTASDNIILTKTTFFPLVPGQFTVPDVNTIILNTTSGLVNASGVFTAVGSASGKTYTADSPEVRIDLVSTFYLPGYTPGITTYKDIPIPVNQGSPSALVSAIFTGLTVINYRTGQLNQWTDTGPILTRVITQLNPQELSGDVPT